MVAFGVAAGAVAAARLISLRNSVKVLPLGAAMGVVVFLMIFVHHAPIAVILLALLGGLSGFFVVPMNALLQHRGHILMGAGHSIAVQNFNENLSILLMTGVYALMMAVGLSIHVIIACFALFLFGTMLIIKRRHVANQREYDAVAHLEG